MRSADEVTIEIYDFMLFRAIAKRIAILRSVACHAGNYLSKAKDLLTVLVNHARLGAPTLMKLRTTSSLQPSRMPTPIWLITTGVGPSSNPSRSAMMPWASLACWQKIGRSFWRLAGPRPMMRCITPTPQRYSSAAEWSLRSPTSRVSRHSICDCIADLKVALATFNCWVLAFEYVGVNLS